MPATAAHYHEDLSAQQQGAARPNPDSIVRGVAGAVSVGLALDSGQLLWGDCVSPSQTGSDPQLAGFTSAAGAHTWAATIHETVEPALLDRDVADFRSLAAEIDALTETVVIERPVPRPDAEAGPISRRALLTAPFRALAGEERPETPTERVAIARLIHPAVRYGVSQALLAATATARGVTMAEVIAHEWGLPRPGGPLTQLNEPSGTEGAVPIHGRCGRDRYHDADRMIVRRLASLPGLQVEDAAEQVGEDAVLLTRYVRWLRDRIERLGGKGYAPTIYLDLNGALGDLYGDNLGKVLGALRSLQLAAVPYPVRVESPVIRERRAAQIETMATLVDYVRLSRVDVTLVAGAWADTLDDIRAFIDASAAHMIHIDMPGLGSVHNAVDAILACREAGVGAFLGGGPAETDLSARVSAHVALATWPDIVLAKPGQDVDVAATITANEMARSLAEIRARSED